MAHLAMLTGDLRAGFSIAMAGAELPTVLSVLGRSNFKRISPCAPWRSTMICARACRPICATGMSLSAIDPGSQVGRHAALEDWAAFRRARSLAATGDRQASSVASTWIAVDNYNSAVGRNSRSPTPSCGDFAGRRGLIAPTAADCNDCLRARAPDRGVGTASDARADWWFARAVAQAPSSPFGLAEWGQALLARGKPDDGHRQIHRSPTRKARTSPIRWKAGARR